MGVPAGIRSGDVLLAQIVIADGTGTNVPMAPAGWTFIRDDAVNNGNKMTSWLYFHVAGSSEPATYAWKISSQFAAAVMGAWRGASASSTIDKSGGATAAGPSPISVAAPSLTPANNNELQVYFYGSQNFNSPTITEPAAITQLSNIESSKEGFTLAYGQLAAPPAGTASATYSATSTFPLAKPVITGQAVLLRIGP